jgi:A/G-specific adenine glycosylase
LKEGEFKKKIWDYYRKNGRSLPWRKTTDPYKILVSEIMLQQTQVDRVIPKYKAFLKKFPTIKKLAIAEGREVLALWSGLGYNRRALNLKRAGEAIVSKHKGKFPKTKTVLIELPGIGPYTAGAVSAFAWNNPEVFIETNIRRVYIHFFFSKKKSVHDKDILSLVEQTVDKKNPREWYWALMDYGSMLKRTMANPNRKSAHYTKQSKFKGSVREVRGRVLRELLSQKKVSRTVLQKDASIEQFNRAVDGLIKEGLIKKSRDFYTLT